MHWTASTYRFIKGELDFGDSTIITAFFLDSLTASPYDTLRQEDRTRFPEILKRWRESRYFRLEGYWQPITGADPCVSSMSPITSQKTLKVALPAITFSVAP